MVRVLVGVLLLSAPAAAADPPPLRFQYRAGDSLRYTLTQSTTVTETALDDRTAAPVTTTTTTKLTLARRWDVKDLSTDGSAVLELTITAMRQEIDRPGGAADRVVIDSETEDGRKQTAAYLNKPVLRAKLDPLGRATEVTALVGSGDRARVELPFRVTLPEAAAAVGATWDRPAFGITLDPPFGTGEKFDAAQSFALKSVDGGTATVTLATTLKAPPTDPAQMPALIPLLWDGEAYFDAAAGRYAGAKLRVKREVANHQGTGSKFRYESELTETPAK